MCWHHIYTDKRIINQKQPQKPRNRFWRAYVFCVHVTMDRDIIYLLRRVISGIMLAVFVVFVIVVGPLSIHSGSNAISAMHKHF